MTVTTPDWLTRHGGELSEGMTNQAWLVLLGGTPQYRLVPVPANGKFGCQVTETVNGRRLDGRSTFPTRDDALRGGLEELRQALGW